MRILVILAVVVLAVGEAQAAPKLAPLPPEIAEIAPNFYRYSRSWTRLRSWVRRNYGKQSEILPLAYKNGVAVLTVHAKEDRFKWTTIHFFRIGDKIRISVVPRDPA